MPTDRKQIVLQIKGAKSVSTDYMAAHEADDLLKTEVAPKIGTTDTIILPGVVVQGGDVVTAEFRSPPSFA